MTVPRGEGRSGRLSAPQKIILPLLPLLMVLAALCIGRITVTPADLFRSLAFHLFGGEVPSALAESVLWNMRLPRILLALLAGGGLSAAGCAFQSLFSNPLATPDTLGVASGASFGAALGLLLDLDLIGVQLISLLFGAAAVALAWLAGKGRRQGLGGLILAGILIGSLFSSLVSLVKFAADPETKLPSITYWLMGSLGSAGYGSLALGAPLILGGVLTLLLLRWRLNLLPLDEDEARASGTNLHALRAVTVFCATAITASCVSMCGQVGWVGLLIPHFCRMKFGSNQLSLLPASVLTGAAFLVFVDTAARSLSPAEIPVSILTAIIGAPFFLLMMRRSGGWQL